MDPNCEFTEEKHKPIKVGQIAFERQAVLIREGGWGCCRLEHFNGHKYHEGGVQTRDLPDDCVKPEQLRCTDCVLYSLKISFTLTTALIFE